MIRVWTTRLQSLWTMLMTIASCRLGTTAFWAYGLRFPGLPRRVAEIAGLRRSESLVAETRH